MLTQITLINLKRAFFSGGFMEDVPQEIPGSNKGPGLK